MGIDKRMGFAFGQFEPGKSSLMEIRSAERDANEMLRRALIDGRHRTGLEDFSFGPLVVSQNRIRGPSHFLAFVNARVIINRYHVGPMFEVFLSCRGELMLSALGPAMEILDLPEAKGGRR